MDKSGLRFVVHFQLIEQPRNLTKKTQNYNLELSSQRGQASSIGGSQKKHTSITLVIESSGQRFLAFADPLLLLLVNVAAKSPAPSAPDHSG